MISVILSLPLIKDLSILSNNFSKVTRSYLIPLSQKREIDDCELCLFMLSCWPREKQLGGDKFIVSNYPFWVQIKCFHKFGS